MLTLLYRVHHHGITCKDIGAYRASKRIHNDKICMGNLCRCNTPLASRVQSKEGRTRAPWRCVSQDDEEWVGITSASSLDPSVVSVLNTGIASHRLSLSKPRCKLVVSEMPTYLSRGSSSVHRYDYVHILTVAVLKHFVQGRRRTCLSGERSSHRRHISHSRFAASAYFS